MKETTVKGPIKGSCAFLDLKKR